MNRLSKWSQRIFGSQQNRAALFSLSLLTSQMIGWLPAKAQDIPLQSQQAAIDMSTPAPETKKESRLLNGQVSQAAASDAAASQGDSRAHRSGIFINGVNITGDRIQDFIDKIRAARAEASERRPIPLTADDYRKMEYGVLGVVFRLNGPHPTIQQVFPTCPAAQAGIEPGDEVVMLGGHEPRQREGQITFWYVAAGKAGTSVDMTVRRDGELITFHLVRMNIEDIQDTRIRGNYEHMLAILGPPNGRYSGDAGNLSTEQVRSVSGMSWPGIAPDLSKKTVRGDGDSDSE
ncbi:MAG TPA: PDZ domain-containing protein [Oculatellaceae cyanobacterium]